MLAVSQQNHLKIEEYLEFEESAELKSEYYDGEVIPLAGASINHNRIAGNLYAFLNLAFRGKPYHAFMSDMRLWIPIQKSFTYPDIMVIDGEPDFAFDRSDTITNPCMIAEVLSGSTAMYDRGDKFEMYRSIKSLKEYLLVSQEVIAVEHFVKDPEGKWLLKDNYQGENKIIKLDSLTFVLSLSDLYDKVTF